MRVTEALEAGLASMRPSEADVVRRILRDLGCVATGSLRDVAARCETSDATVIRACRAAGFDGFQDLKYRVLRELTEGGDAAPVAGGESAEPSYAQDIAATLAACEATVGAAAKLLRGASRVGLVGVGASLGVATVLMDVLFALGKRAVPLASEEAVTFALTRPVSGLVVLAVSHSGETRFVLRALEEAREAGVKTVGVTNAPASELARSVDVLLPTRCVERPQGSFAIAPRMCQLAALDRLVDEMRRGARA